MFYLLISLYPHVYSQGVYANFLVKLKNKMIKTTFKSSNPIIVNYSLFFTITTPIYSQKICQKLLCLQT